MAEEEKKKDAARQIREDDRFRYIGFEVYPGKPKDLFKSDEEREKYVDALKAKRERGEIIREDCKLTEERVSWTDRIVLTFASIVVIASLFIPWFSIYNEVEETTRVPAAQEQEAVADTTQALSGSEMTSDTLGSAALAAADQEPVGEPVEGEVVGARETAEAEGDVGGALPGEPDLAEISEEPGPQAGEGVASQRVSESEEVIHGYVAKKRYYKEYERVSAIGAVVSLGSIGSVLFSSGIPLVLTTILMLLYLLACIAFPLYTLYGIWGVKGDADAKALQLKKILRLNWLPLVLFTLAIFLSFMGGDYGTAVGEEYSSLGDSYSIGVFLDSLSWGVIITIAATILLAAKGSEI